MTYQPNLSVASKDSVRVASTGNLVLTGLQTVDGVALAVGNRVLLKNQAAAAQNGIYVAATGAWARAADADQNAEVKSGLRVFVSEGSANIDKIFVLVTDDPIVLGTTPLTFQEVTGGGGGGGGDEITGQTTAGVGSGYFGYVSANNTWSLALNDGVFAQARVAGYNAGVVGEMMPAGTIADAARFTTVGGLPTVGDYVFLAASVDDGGAGAGKLTATAPTTSGQYLVVAGVCIDNSNYLALKTCKIEFNPQQPVLL
jgi:hypothetical protein